MFYISAFVFCNMLLFHQRYLALKASVSSLLKVGHFTLLGYTLKPNQAKFTNILLSACFFVEHVNNCRFN